MEQYEKRFNRKRYICCSNTLTEYKCEICGYTTGLKVNLVEHIRLIHEEKRANGTITNLPNTYRCAGCYFRTQSILVLLKHLQNCNSVFMNNSGEHILEEDSNSEYMKWLNCDQCTYKCRYRSHLERHFLTKHATLKEKEVMKRFKCETCSYKTYDNGILKRHVLARHTKMEHINWFKCDHCTYKSKFKSALTRHVFAKHTNPKETNCLKCEYCPVKCKEKVGLERHLMLRHNLSWLKCEHCSFQTKRKQSLQCHTLSKHADPASCVWYKCESCPYKNVHKRNLKQHIINFHIDKRKCVDK